MIDPSTETLLSLTQAAKMLPARRVGKRPHVSCLYRWSTAGCRGVVLETIQVGGTRCTSREALARFVRRLTVDRGPDAGAVETPLRHRRRRRREVAAAVRELEREGL
ncbi:MAG: DUF1580 domain-containing protein [Planctomycetia bacterium]|nr:DUF1580 domain-containing protein [Planctomycetia bacterium]